MKWIRSASCWIGPWGSWCSRPDCGTQDGTSERSLAGYILLAKDHRLAARPLEAYAIYAHDAKVVVFVRGDLTAEKMGDLCVQYELKIHGLALAPGAGAG